MADLAAYPNVYNTALVILERQGWATCFDREARRWHAKKDGWELLADDPLELLGLAAIHAHHAPTAKSEYWWKIDAPDLISIQDPA